MTLYDARHEHDGCGVACVARLGGEASHETVVRALRVLDNLEHRGAYATPAAGVFAAGDARRGQSLIVTAIAEGRGCARAVGAYLSSSPAAGSAARRDLAAAP